MQSSKTRTYIHQLYNKVETPYYENIDFKIPTQNNPNFVIQSELYKTYYKNLNKFGTV